MGLVPWSLHGSLTFEVLDLAGKHFAGWKEIVPCRPEEYFSFPSGSGGGRGQSRHGTAGHSWLRQG